MTPLEPKLKERIAREGPLAFSDFMTVALYDPDHGYYAAPTARTGWEGHFVTSPELDPAFGELWTRAIAEVHEKAGAPERFTVIEIGPGEAGAARAIVDALPEEVAGNIDLVLIERSPAARSRQRERLGNRRARWAESLQALDRQRAAFVLANEILDNLPVRLVESRSGQLIELYVGWTGGHFELIPGDLSEDARRLVDGCGVEVPDGVRCELPVGADAWLHELCDVVESGALVFVDYGHTWDEAIARPAGTLATYGGGGADDDPLLEPGTRDITTHANWSHLESVLVARGWTVCTPRPQRKVLQELGLGAIDQGLRESYDEALAEGRGADAVEIYSRRNALAALADPGGLGGLEVAAGLKDIEPPGFLA